ncbi:thiolase-like protein [Calocera cornea HHB12733]|uniref:Thiolase-like protein n=1 Tax=Calocera cornea HHB12733 TaxID=1353952 RepID=A0A165HS99_9BASI|nr:thiolase-like protein [Calocera cornea HHB12733]
MGDIPFDINPITLTPAGPGVWATSRPSAAAASPDIPVTVLPPSLPVGIFGMGVSYGPHDMLPEEFEAYALAHYPASPAMLKTLKINRSTLIRKRGICVPLTSPHLSGPAPRPVEDSVALFLAVGVDLAASAARKALKDWGGSVREITHLVCVTVCASSNPGFDHYLSSALGLSSGVQKTLLHGVGCTGGLAMLRHAAQLVLAAQAVGGRKATVLCVASELPSLYYRHALEDVHTKGEVGPGVTLFADGAGAFVAPGAHKKPIYTVRAYTTLTLPSSAPDLAVNISSSGYNAALSRRVPALTGACALPVLAALQDALGTSLQAGEMDWALHPGGAAVVKAVQQAAQVPEGRLRATWEVYGQQGNVAAVTIVGVLQAMRGWDVQAGEGRQDVLATAFGPGINVEMMMLRRG